jgi:protein gp37
MAWRLACMGIKGYRKVIIRKGDYNHQKNKSENMKACWNGKVFCDESLLDKPLHWRKPRTIFVCNMGDLFHEKVPFEFILKIIGITMVTPWHTYLILTKRIERLPLFLEWWREQWRKNPIVWGKDALALEAIECLPTNLEKANQYWLDNFDQSKRGKLDYPIPHPQPNLHLGVTVCNQAEADEKIPILLQIPAAHKFLSIEPCLGAVDLEFLTEHTFRSQKILEFWDTALLDWVVLGGESGPKARPLHPDWARSIRDQCVAAGVPFYFKQWGEYLHESQGADTSGPINAGGTSKKGYRWPDRTWSIRVGKKKAGRLLDGKLWNQKPIQ